jgi:hypothetical protein
MTRERPRIPLVGRYWNFSSAESELHLRSQGFVEDKRLPSPDGSSTALLSTDNSGTVVPTQSCVRDTQRNRAIRGIQENRFRELYSGFVNGILIPTDEVQHARMRDSIRKKGTASPTSPTNEGEWTEVKNKVKKVRFMCQDRFGKNKTNG